MEDYELISTRTAYNLRMLKDQLEFLLHGRKRARLPFKIEQEFALEPSVTRITILHKPVGSSTYVHPRYSSTEWIVRGKGIRNDVLKLNSQLLHKTRKR